MIRTCTMYIHILINYIHCIFMTVHTIAGVPLTVAKLANGYNLFHHGYILI